MYLGFVNKLPQTHLYEIENIINFVNYYSRIIMK